MDEVTNVTNINKNNISQKCSKCRKLMPINQFINKKNHTLKTCNLCRQHSSDFYKKSIENDEKEILLPKVMAERLFDEVTIIGSNEYFENESVGVDFECNITLDDYGRYSRRNIKKDCRFGW